MKSRNSLLPDKVAVAVNKPTANALQGAKLDRYKAPHLQAESISAKLYCLTAPRSLTMAPVFFCLSRTSQN